LKYAKACGNYLKELKKIQKNDLIILDDFGLDVLDKESRMSLFELLEERSERKSILIASQLPVENWYDVIGEKNYRRCDLRPVDLQFTIHSPGR
jgi:DNA replication protein DnaC